MPGIGKLGDKDFIRAFQVIDRIIQNNQPIFMVVWLGSVLAIILTAVSGYGRLDMPENLIIGIAAIIYVFGVQVPTGVVNVPLNNKLQKVDLDIMSDSDAKIARNDFELRWNKWNRIRTYLASLSTILLLILLFIR
jgi:uncharacterized membrane protein